MWQPGCRVSRYDLSYSFTFWTWCQHSYYHALFINVTFSCTIYIEGVFLWRPLPYSPHAVLLISQKASQDDGQCHGFGSQWYFTMRRHQKPFSPVCVPCNVFIFFCPLEGFFHNGIVNIKLMR